MGDPQPIVEPLGVPRPRSAGRVGSARKSAQARRHRRIPRFDLSSLKARGRWFALLAALFAFSLQSFVAETHRHPRAETESRLTVGKPDGTAQPGKPRAPADSPANCSICRELAHTAYYLPPAPISFNAPMAAFALLLVAAALFLTPRRPSHGWRSRAPPALSRT